VSRDRRFFEHFLQHVLAGAAVGAMTLANPALAADLPVKAPQLRPAFDWSGFYIGGHTGYSRGASSAMLTDPLLAASSGTFSGVIGGVQAGYNVRLPSGLLLGVEADLTFPNYLTSNSIVSRLTTANSDVTHQLDYVGTVRGRIGYTQGPWLAYATGGLAYAGERFLSSPAVGDEEKDIHHRLGWAAGAGLEYGFAPHWSVRLEYLYSQFERANVRFPSGAQYNSTLDFQQLRIGLNRKVDWPGSSSWTPKTDLTDPESDRWEIHGQTTYLPQGYPSFRAPYTGTNSFTPAPQAKATWSNSLFLNARLWEGGEVYYNPELLQGFGLNDTVGAAGFPNGEAQKSNFPYPHYNTSRLFLRQTFGFGGEQEEFASSAQQLAGLGKQRVPRFQFEHVGSALKNPAVEAVRIGDRLHQEIARSQSPLLLIELGGGAIGQADLVGRVVEGSRCPDRPVHEILAGILGVGVAVENIGHGKFADLQRQPRDVDFARQLGRPAAKLFLLAAKTEGLPQEQP
jgi:high affinity Mn2+ porin